jgi:mannonate dehydratase
VKLACTRRPPAATVRGEPRIVYLRIFTKGFDLTPDPRTLSNTAGTLAEMTEGNLYEAVEQYSRQRRLAYVHFRNVTGKAPFYKETFVDDGDIDMLRVVRILHQTGFEGVLIPDHTPQMTCAAPWHAGMAYAMGYLRAALQTVTGQRHPG